MKIIIIIKNRRLIVKHTRRVVEQLTHLTVSNLALQTTALKNTVQLLTRKQTVYSKILLDNPC